MLTGRLGTEETMEVIVVEEEVEEVVEIPAKDMAGCFPTVVEALM
jgi:urease accessory protein UreE